MGSVRRSETLGENRESMKKLYEEAKQVGEKANQARAAISSVKNRLKKGQMERAMTSNPHNPEVGQAMPDDPETEACLREIEEHKCIYQQCTQRLNHLKAEIEQQQKSAEQKKQNLQKDFEAWCVSANVTVAVPNDLPPSQASA